MTGSLEPREAKFAKRRRDRAAELSPEQLSLLEAGNSILYQLDGEPIREYPDGSRFVVRAAADGRSGEVHVREVLSDAERQKLRAFIDEPNGVVERARAFGIDVSLTLQSALLTPEERWRRANDSIADAQRLFGSARRIRTDRT